MYAANKERISAIAKDEANTEVPHVIIPVDCSLFEVLSGKWTASMTGSIKGETSPKIITFPVTIAAGAGTLIQSPLALNFIIAQTRAVRMGQ